MRPDEFNVWEGSYATFRDAPVQGLGFDSPTWRTRSARAAQEAHADFVAGRPLDYSLRQRNSVLVVLAAALLARKPRLRILDFGGGPGFGFLALQASLPNAASRISYEIVEVEGVCREAELLFRGHPAPTFHTALPEAEARSFDVVFTASTIQYIEDWSGMCSRLAAYRAPHLLLSDVFAGSFGSYVTLQQYYGSKIAHWMLNEDDLVAAVHSNGYGLDLKTPCDVQVLGAGGELPMGNFPAERRLKNANHFLFSLPAP